MGQSFLFSDALSAYVHHNWVRDQPLLAQLREETSQHPRAMMQIAAEEGQLLDFLVRLIGAKKCLEIGVFTGYSALVTALAMGDGGLLVALDVEPEFTSVGERYWERAGVRDRIDLRLAPALESLAALSAEGHDGSFDFCFIDADKPNYSHYLDAAHRLLRVGGLFAIDNVLWSGRVADAADTELDTAALRELNAKLHDDARFDLCLIAIGDGVTLLRKR